jgi:hypothetical protein
MPSGIAETSLSKPPIESQVTAFTRYSLQHALSSTQPPKHPDSSLRHTPPQQFPHAHDTANLKSSKNFQLNPTQPNPTQPNHKPSIFQRPPLAITYKTNHQSKLLLFCLLCLVMYVRRKHHNRKNDPSVIFKANNNHTSRVK